ncbi:MAG: hypothetical protein JJT89_17470 [Nitriliruptoraceae bacterium]|nr:hypothetical protein [Nitriliruptoraceae bacterium]
MKTSVEHASDVAERAGARRRLERCTSPSGHFFVCAIDHPMGTFVSGNGRPAPVPAVRALKSAVLEESILGASAVIVDPELGIPAIWDAELTQPFGMIVNAERFEDRDGDPVPGGRRANWDASHMVTLGADAVKYVFTLSSDPFVTADREAEVRELIVEAHRFGLPVVAEPLAPDPSDEPEAIQRHARAIIQAAATYSELGADVLKVQFPGSIETQLSRREARAACQELSDAVAGPWVLLSQGVGFDAFLRQMRIASDAGASGFMAGRALWGDVSHEAPFVGREVVRRRLDELAWCAGAGASLSERLPTVRPVASGPGWWLRDRGAFGLLEEVGSS